MVIIVPDGVAVGTQNNTLFDLFLYCLDIFAISYCSGNRELFLSRIAMMEVQGSRVCLTAIGAEQSLPKLIVPFPCLFFPFDIVGNDTRLIPLVPVTTP
jgi:hypothetical protein